VSNGNTAYASDDGVLFDKSKETIIAYPGGKTESSYTIPNSVTTIGDLAFQNCSNLISITIPSSATTIGNVAFEGCSSLRNVVVLRTTPPSITSGTTDSYFDDSDDTFSDDTFYQCPLSSATLSVPSGCKEAYEGAAGWNEFGTIVETN
jgi:hypothetical protein